MPFCSEPFAAAGVAGAFFAAPGTRVDLGKSEGANYLIMFFPKLTFVPTVIRALLRPRSSKSEKRL